MITLIRRSLVTLAALACISSAALLHKTKPFNTANTVIVFDLDDVLLFKPTGYKVRFALNGWNKNLYTYFSGLNSMKNAQKIKNGKKAFYDVDGTEIHGVTFQFLHTAMLNPNLRPHTAELVKFTEEMRYPNQEMVQLIKQLKSQGYSIAFATNKDRVSYDYAAHYHGLDELVDRVFVAQPGNSEALINNLTAFIEKNTKTLPRNYVELAQKALTIEPSTVIYHAPTQKPNSKYYDYVIDTIGHNKHIIFVDDKHENTQSFKALHTNEFARIGIQFKNPTQLKLDLYSLDVLYN